MSKRSLIDKKPFNRSFINAEEITFLQTDASGILISASEHLSTYTGLSIKELVGSSLFNHTSTKDHPKLSSLLKKKKSSPSDKITILIKGEKKNRPINFTIHYLAGTNNRNFLLNWTVDPKITNTRNRGRSALKLIGQMFSSNPQPVIIFNPINYHIAYANQAATAIYGYNQSEFLQLSINDLLTNYKIDPDNTFVSGNYLLSRKNEPGVLTEVFISPIMIDKKSFAVVFLNTVPDTDIIQSVQIKQSSQDIISFAKEIDKSGMLHASDGRNENLTDTREILDNSPTIFFKLDSEGNFLFVSDEFERLLGFSSKEIFGRHFTSIILQEDLDVAKQGFADIFQFGRAQAKVNFRAVKKNGGFEWFSTYGIFFFDQKGKPLHCIGFAQNITEIKQLVEKLEASEERYAAFINHSSEAIWRFETADPIPLELPEEEIIYEFFTKGYLAECNDQMAKLYGFEEAADIAGAPLASFMPADNQGTQEYFKGFIQSGFKLVNVETHETDKNGNKKIFLNNLLGIVENKKLVRVWGTQRDVTEQRTAENKAKQQLEQSENFFKSLISDSLDGIVILNTEGVITYAAESITNVLGFLPGEVIGKNCFEFIHPEDLPIANEAFDISFSQIKSPYLEARFHSKKGEWLWMLVRSNNLYHQPSIRGLVVYVTNITQRKHTENILKESEKRFRNLADTVPVMIWVTDESNKSTYVSKCWSDFTGVSLEKIISDGWIKIIHPEDHQVAIGRYDRYFKAREPFVIEYRIRSKEGDYKWVVDHGVPRFTADGIFIGYIGSVIDIHYRKTAEQKLRYQAAMIENIRDAIISTDLDFNIIALNNMAEEMYGFTKEEVIGKPIRSLIKHEYISVSKQNVLIELYEKDSWEGEVYFDRNDGKRIYLFFSLSFVKNDRGQRIGLVGIHRDITQRYAAEIALRISEERYRSVVEALNEGIILQDRTGKIITGNKRAALILGDNFVGRILKFEEVRCVYEDGTKVTADNDPFSITLRTGKALQEQIIGFQRPGDSFYWFSINTEPIYYSGQSTTPDAVVTSCFDITQRKQQEQWLSLEKDVLEINAQASATLKNTVDFYLQGIEKMFPDMMCSVLLLNDDKKTIRHLSSPSMPGTYAAEISGLKIGPKAGSSGTAMFLKKRILTNDIKIDPIWEEYRDFAAKYDLQSCWSFPITNSQNEVLATIAGYHKYPKVPSNKELNIMEVACNLLRIIFENKQAEANLRLSNERYLLATKATHDAIYDWDIIENTVYRGESFQSLFGYPVSQGGDLLGFLEEKLHPDDMARVTKSLRRFVESKSADIWESEYRFLNAVGKYVVVYDRGFLIFNQDGNITRLVGSMMDITERKELEKRLVKQEVDKQKLVAQAVVNAQEKERAEIGKELHDNVNQILSTARLYLELAKSDEKERIPLINRSYDNIYDAINEIRSISRSLVPPSIGDLGLIESIEDLVENIKATKKLYIEFCHDDDIDSLLGQKQKLMLFRIIQEQVNNVLKHAEARNLIIELMIDANMINLAVSDDGKGFDYENVKNNKGAGLQNIASRTELFNGKINIVTAPGRGCKLNIHVPISKL